jgi:acyl-CoA thioester hydrolase
MSGTTVDIPVAVRWSDQDRNGHVNNAVTVTLIEEARVQWRLKCVAQGGLAPDFVALVANLTLDYRQPVNFGPQLDVTVGVNAVGARSYTLSFAGHQEGTLVFEATTVMVAVGPNGKSRVLDDYERDFLLSWQSGEN